MIRSRWKTGLFAICCNRHKIKTLRTYLPCLALQNRDRPFGCVSEMLVNMIMIDS